MAARIHSREDLQHNLKEMIDGIERSKAAVQRKRKLPASAKAFSVSDLNNKQAVLWWAWDMTKTMPEDIKIDENGETQL